MKRVGLIISILFNIILLIGIGLLLATPKKCTPEKSKTEPVANENSIVCEKAEEEASEDYSESLRVELIYDGEGTVTSIIDGTTVTYKDGSRYNEAKKELPESSKDLGNNQIYYYTTSKIEATDENGNTQGTWFKDYIKSLEKDGYKCQ